MQYTVTIEFGDLTLAQTYTEDDNPVYVGEAVTDQIIAMTNPKHLDHVRYMEIVEKDANTDASE